MQSYNNVTAAAWQCGIAAAEQYGVSITTNSGSASTRGYSFTWSYDPGAQTLSLQCTDSPTIVPCFVINAAIDHAVTDCLDENKIVLTNMVPK